MRRKLGVLMIFAAAVPLAAASVAWACGVLATVSADTRVASPGQAVTVTGSNYASRNASAVTLRLNGRNGPVLATATPDSNGRINQTFTLPSNVDPGWYVVLATQFNANGTPKSGTPGRTTLRVQGSASGSAAPAAAPWRSSPPTGPAASPAITGGDAGGGSLLPMLLATALSLTMLAGGWTLVRRRRPVSAPRLGI